ncbi:ATP-binding protein [Nocardioides sp. Soil805]|uniref:ATP-binding protein n=1 Tax=Nocardioides sp. Soil805 TaxID=1736416 RepID=UPI000702A2B4|nr:AAA family ATPase [Nocardioides sp. Soil805]KRF32415.1 hypothetical protein ASG94_18320 [Nocardioides sp. Soil805]
MGALPRPDLPPGPRRELNDALHDLHHLAGWPSLRTLARETGVSHTTVSHVLSTPRLPTWGVVELLVEALHGDRDHLHVLWLDASTSGDDVAGSAPRIAGRRAEVAAVRRHLETGAGLLLVTGEAGIGKTTLVTTAAGQAGCFVAVARCLPLSTQVPLMPIADALRSVLTHEGGEWFEDALRACPAYVAPTLGVLLPELDVAPPPPMGGGSDRQRFFSAVAAVLEALGHLRPWALVIEDVPWADAVTLDLLERLVAGTHLPPVVATWRTEDPDLPDEHLAWRGRTSRRAATLHLEALTLAETTEQLRLLGVDAATDAEAIHRRSLGQPLFTEQLAAAGSDRVLPGELQTFLARRITDLDEDAWVLARTLAVADRPLTASELATAAGLDADPTPALRSLDSRRLLAEDRDVVRLRHPLVAEAIRHRLVPGEGDHAHRAVARLLAELPDPAESEIADHLKAVGDSAGELVWRIRAARSAERRFAREEAYPLWKRALELWPRPDTDLDSATTLTEVHVRVIETSIAAGAGEVVVRRHVEDAMAASLPDQGRAEVLMRAGDLECAVGDEDEGLRLIEEAVAISDRYPPTADAVHILEVRANILGSLGRHAEVRAVVEKGLVMAESVGAVALHRVMLALKAWTLAEQGKDEEAVALAAEARLMAPASEDPACALRVAAWETDVLLATGAPRETVAAAAAGALAEADRWHIPNLFTDSVVAAVALAHLRAGDVTAAAAVVDPRLRDHTRAGLGATQDAHCAILLRRGRLDEAQALLRTQPSQYDYNYNVSSSERDVLEAELCLWAGRLHDAREPIDRTADFLLSGGYAATSSRVLALHARMEADLGSSDTRDRERAERRRRVTARRSSGHLDPLGPDARGPDLVANRLLWCAELDRIDSSDRLEQWVEAAAAWDRVTRPHDAAYCRWRGAQVALREGRATLAARLLKRAAADAREHVPLLRAITATGSGR